jgi:hypothetical protein
MMFVAVYFGNRRHFLEESAGTLLYLLHFIVVLKVERKIHRDPSSKRYFKRKKKGKKTEIENASLENEYQCIVKLKYGSCSLKHWLTYYWTCGLSNKEYWLKRVR